MNVILFLRLLGNRAINICAHIFLLTNFLTTVVRCLCTPPYYFNVIIQQLINICFYSLSLVALTAFFSGSVLALQTYDALAYLPLGVSNLTVSRVVVISTIREIGPVIVGLMIASRVGASIAAEISSMRVTEQIDALIMLATHPVRYLVIPRVIATSIALPFLVLVSDVIGIFGGYTISIYKIGIDSSQYLHNTISNLEFYDVAIGLAKSLIFGNIIALVSSYHGYYSAKGAQGVGIATMNSVVYSSISILAVNYLITELFFSQ